MTHTRGGIQGTLLIHSFNMCDLKSRTSVNTTDPAGTMASPLQAPLANAVYTVPRSTPCGSRCHVHPVRHTPPYTRPFTHTPPNGTGTC
ncbi:hypothetical protein Hamer_G004055 [Homarus americanus]|uniref:Uncharacterized protein n=1 Tax=Homarus americanus TaxID=6706 RepID=A0A8J5JUF9_HOMAM|nr:hypothetical protein Hamer_G004055 [Homarus americanus]